MAIALKENELKAEETSIGGGVVAVVDVEVSGGLTPNTALQAGRGSFAITAVGELPDNLMHKALRTGGHSKITGKGSFVQIVAPGRKLQPTLRELPGGTTIEFSEAKNSRPLEISSKSALVQSNFRDLVPAAELLGDPSKYVRYKMNVYTPSQDLQGFGVKITPDSAVTALTQDPQERVN